MPASKVRAAVLEGPAASRALAEVEQMRLTWWRKDIENARRMAATIGYDLALTDRVHRLLVGITVSRIADIVDDRDPDA